MATGEARAPGMAEKDICIMHVVNNSSGKLTAFTYTSWCNFLTYAAKWKLLNCNEAKIASTRRQDLDCVSSQRVLS